ncbi:MAG: single-stranded-DNA-specific exonuclease RecJ, partial [Actinomycetota bacterium]
MQLMRTSRWHTSPLPYATIRNLSQSLDVSEVFATVLARRGYSDPGMAASFLSPLGKLHNPFLFPEMASVCERINSAIAGKEKVCVHGDYDVDGVTATALLAVVLRQAGASVTCHLPNRFSEGYG